MVRNTEVLHKAKYRNLTIGMLLGIVILACHLMPGCSTGIGQRQTTETPTHSADESTLVTEKGGAQLWAENCMRCHNIRDPKSYSDAEWQVAVHHMRVRANLTAEEHTEILAFLQSAN